MRNTLHKTLLILGFSFLLANAAYSQSLGDVARQEREKKAKEAQTAPKVLTNDDLPKEGNISSVGNGISDPVGARPMGSQSAEQWKSQIEAQKHVVDDLQNRITRLNSSIHFATGYACYHCAQYNEKQLQKEDNSQALQQQLAGQKQKLQQMQDAARQEGFGNAVYEP